jgi:hypothetical protein
MNRDVTISLACWGILFLFVSVLVLVIAHPSPLELAKPDKLASLLMGVAFFSFFLFGVLLLPSRSGHWDGWKDMSKQLAVFSLIISVASISAAIGLENEAMKHKELLKLRLDAGLHLVQTGKVDEGMAALNNLVRENPMEPVVYRYRAAAYSKLGKTREAKKDEQWSNGLGCKP